MNLEDSLRRLSILHELTSILGSSLDLDVELEDFLQGLGRTLGLEAAAIVVAPTGEAAEVAPRAVIGIPRRERAALRVPRAWLERLRAAPGGLFGESPFPQLAGAAQSLRLLTREADEGALVVLRSTPMGASEQRILESLSQRLAVALSNERAREAQRARDRALAEALKRARDAAEAASRTKSEFLATISHELRTPMHAVLSLSALLHDSPLTPDQRRQVQAIEHSAGGLVAIVDVLLDLPLAEAGRLELVNVDFELAPTVTERLAALNPAASARGLMLDWSLSPELPRRVHGDPGRLGQIISNLVGNSLKFTSEGGVTVRLRPAAEGTLRCEVSDSGIGISREAQSRLFLPFSQVDGSMRRRFGGAGLGLSIVKYLVSLMGGEVGVESEPGRGSTFWFTARLGAPREATAPKPALRPLVEAVPLPFREVLLAEDNPLNRMIVVRQLEKAGCTVTPVVNGLEAVHEATRRPFDLVLMDCQMPELDGLAATREIRRFEAERGDGRRLPIVAVTANATSSDRELCFACGMDGFVSKPFKPHELLDAMRAAWAARQR